MDVCMSSDRRLEERIIATKGMECDEFERNIAVRFEAEWRLSLGHVAAVSG